MEFIRGKYDPSDDEYIQRLLTNMTQSEQRRIMTEEFDTLWTILWGVGRDTRSTEYFTAKHHYYSVDRARLVNDTLSVFTDPEWGFPKGRRSKGESDLECGIREFWEETNITSDAYTVIPSLTLVEIFTGTNNIHYKHVYFIALLKNSSYLPDEKLLTPTQKREVSDVGWKTLDRAYEITRPHYAERKKILHQLGRIIQEYESV
jgi:8-oxo-dGTP pyrophosphatase MutT (NUDIX family)